MVCKTDGIDVVRLEGWPAGTLMGDELVTGTVAEGIRIGLAEMREKRKKGRMLWGRIALLFLEGKYLDVLTAEDEDEIAKCRRNR